MRIVAIVCATVAVALSAFATLGIVEVNYEMTDREALYGSFLLACLAAPFALAAAILSLLNRRKWTTLQTMGSLGIVALVVGVGLWCVALF